MLREVHAGLQRLIHEHGQINPLEVDIRFEAPTRDMVERLLRPTINLFLFEVNENTDLRRNDFQTTRGNGRSERRQAPRRIDLHYMVSVLTSEIADEHQLLWRVLATLMKYHEIPPEILPEELQRLEVPVIARAAQPDDSGRTSELWSALGLGPHPTIMYVVTAPLDLDVVIEAPLVLTRTTQYTRFHDAPEPEIGYHIGGVVRGSDGEPLPGVSVAVEGSGARVCLTDDAGQYVLRRVSPGTVHLLVSGPDGQEQSVTREVPADSYDIVLE